MFVFLYYTPWPPNPFSESPTHRDAGIQRGAEQGWQRMSEHIWGWGKASSIYFPKRPLSNGSTTFLTNAPRLLGLHVAPWILVSLNVSPLSQHIIQLPEIHAWLFHALLGDEEKAGASKEPRGGREICRVCSDTDPFVFILGVKKWVCTQKQMILLFVRADPIGVELYFNIVDSDRGTGKSTV